MSEIRDIGHHIVHAPFGPDQVASLNAFQASGVMHPFTCSGGGGEHHDSILIASRDGWSCGYGDHHQVWAYPWMADWSWQRPTGLIPGSGRRGEPKALLSSLLHVDRVQAQIRAGIVDDLFKAGHTAAALLVAEPLLPTVAQIQAWMEANGWKKVSAGSAGIMWALEGGAEIITPQIGVPRDDRDPHFTGGVIGRLCKAHQIKFSDLLTGIAEMEMEE